MASNDSLQNINSATLGAQMPVVTLPDGSKVQTGTIAALIVNIRSCDELVAHGADADEKKKAELEAMLAAALPLLKRAGEYSEVTREWI